MERIDLEIQKQIFNSLNKRKSLSLKKDILIGQASHLRFDMQLIHEHNFRSKSRFLVLSQEKGELELEKRIF